MSLTINSINSNTKLNTNMTQSHVAFKGRNWKQEYDALLQALKVAKDDAKKTDIAKKLEKLAEEAKDAVDQRVKNSSFETKIDKAIEGFFTGVAKIANMLTKNLTKKLDNGEDIDIAKKATAIVLVGNTAKEVMGTGLYTVQAMTNEDLPQEKRKFVGMYDLFVGICSTIISLIFGIGLQSAIEKGYGKLFKPLKASTRIGLIAAIGGFTSFALQTIVGKRMIAPAVGAPFAGKVKKYMMEKESQKEQNNEKQ